MEIKVDMTGEIMPQRLWIGSIQYHKGQFMVVRKVRKFSNRSTGTCYFGCGPSITDEERRTLIALYNARPDVLAYRTEIATRGARVVDSGI